MSSIQFMPYSLHSILGLRAGTPCGDHRLVHRRALTHFVNSGWEFGAQAASYRKRGDS